MKQYLYPSLLFCGLIALMLLSEPAFLRDYLLDSFVVATLLLVLVQLIFAGRTEIVDEFPVGSLIFICLGGALLTGIFWFRITIGAYGFETGLGLNIFKTLFFWVPAVLFASLYRSSGESWKPGNRRTFLIRLLVAVVASLIGLAGQEIAREHIEQVPMDYSLRHVERLLPDGESGIEYQLEQSVLHMEVVLDPSYEEPNIRMLQRIRAIAAQASRLTGRKDTDNLALRITHGGKELAALNWPDPETNRTSDRIRINYTGTGLSNLPTEGDLELLFESLEQAFRPENLEADLYENTLILRWKGDESIPDDPARIPQIIHDWQSVNHTVTLAGALFDGLDAFRIKMPGHTLEVPAERIQGLYRAQQHIPVPDLSALIQIYNSEEMPEPPDLSENVPVRIIWGDGRFDTQRNTTDPLWPWERGILAGYHFYITELDSNGVVRFVIYPAGAPKDARWVSLHPGETKQLFAIYLKYLR
ncbi:MAG: hypothetical protein JJU37_00660 [Balneolaceae bacterium]|nr:hypothetical protein [Balneolaceae bacterium]